MNHRDLRQLISAYKDGELVEHDVQVVQDHMHSCRECREYLVLLQATGDIIRGADVVHLGPEFTNGVMRSVRRDEEQSMLWLPVEQFARRLVLGLSFAVILFVTLSMMFQPREPVVIEPYLAGERSDSSVTRTLLTKDTISKDDVLLAAVTHR
jgi:anti-sigma factor RsiW